MDQRPNQSPLVPICPHCHFPSRLSWPWSYFCPRHSCDLTSHWSGAPCEASDWLLLTPHWVLVDGNQSVSWQLGILGKCRHEMTITCHQPIRGRYQGPLTNQKPPCDTIMSCDNHWLTGDLVLLSIKPRCDSIFSSTSTFLLSLKSSDTGIEFFCKLFSAQFRPSPIVRSQEGAARGQFLLRDHEPGSRGRKGAGNGGWIISIT